MKKYAWTVGEDGDVLHGTFDSIDQALCDAREWHGDDPERVDIVVWDARPATASAEDAELFHGYDEIDGEEIDTTKPGWEAGRWVPENIVRRMTLDPVDRAIDGAMAKIVNDFLKWPLPDSVCSDRVVTMQGAKHRSGTNLLTCPETVALAQDVVRPVVAELVEAEVTRQRWTPAEVKPQEAGQYVCYTTYNDVFVLGFNGVWERPARFNKGEEIAFWAPKPA